ncbi:hypothetical protein PBR20603_01984 [Pandoraea bronchicola]|uniref:Uncharacterized protein n=2 Tax=Pandoraea bronchicola TaxID=2508287 RepID=A0A5E5BUQ9_9BURK|nr:hypothetical protein PBR20603_01984 [Pandoraea bronchicola]
MELGVAMLHQLSLDLFGGLCPARLKQRRAPRPLPITFRPWRQLRLKLPLRRLIKAGKGFIWTRPDGIQFVCKTMRALVARIMDYDGHLLPPCMRSAMSQSLKRQ